MPCSIVKAIIPNLFNRHGWLFNLAQDDLQPTSVQVSVVGQ